TYLTRTFSTHDVPTETVVRSPGFVVPTQSRAYATDLYAVRGLVLDHSTLRQLPRWRSGYGYARIVLVEVWTDHGDDGHIAYCHVGWRFVPETALGWRARWRYIPHEPALPEAMLLQGFEWDAVHQEAML
ncbi:unnamed protein product, partial [marine sediment metagenome]